MAQHRPNRMETPLQLLVEKDQELVRQRRRKAALSVVAHHGYADGPALRADLEALGLDDPELRKRTP